MITQTLWVLITLQICMGAFDTLFHHEFTERLAWRPSQQHELQLHGVRNLFYCALFVGIGWFHFYGVFAWVVGVVLLIELCITLKDFVEEDMTRKLPASERVTHTLLALNYGAILALLAPVLIAWAAQPSSITLVHYGWWTALLTIGGLGVSIFGVRDLLASKRLARMKSTSQARLLPLADTRQSILITGGTGFIGSRLIEALVERGHEVTVLTRQLESTGHLSPPIRVATALEQINDDERFDAVINLAGAPIAGSLWTASYKAKITNSRLETTRAVIALMERLETKPRCFISGSAIGVYGTNTATAVDETTPIAEDNSFAQQLCLAWEAESLKAEALGVRTICLRTGIVLDTAGGTLGQMLFPFEFGLGGPFGKGDQWMSWITRDDLVRLIYHALVHEDVSGPLNATAPGAVTNASFTKALGRTLNRPAVMSIPEFLLTVGLGDLGREIFLASQNVQPCRARATGFVYEAPDIDTAFAQLLKTDIGTSKAIPIGENPVGTSS